MTKPFAVEASDINKLDALQLTLLLKCLLHSEAYKFGLMQREVEVACNINVGDEGEDGSICWTDGPDETDYIPRKFTMFQNKAANMFPADYGNEVLDSAGIVKSKVDEVLNAGGAYIVFTTQELNNKQKRSRIKKMRESFLNLNKSYAETALIKIYDASSIAGWVNLYISAIVAVQSWLGKSLERGVKTHALWGETENYSILKFKHVDSRKDIVASLKGGLHEHKSCFRIEGLSGLGKTRTAYEVFADNEVLKNKVVYYDAGHQSNILGLVTDWVSLNLEGIVVVDNCDLSLHNSLVYEVRRQGSRISLLTLDYNFSSPDAPTMQLRLKPMKNEEVEELLKPIYGDQLHDLSKIAAFAQGFPQVAVLLAEARLTEDPRVGELSEDEFFNKLLWNRGESKNDQHLKVLRVCSLFDVFGCREEVESQLEFISELCKVDIDDVFECVEIFSKRGIIDSRGRFGQVVPKPLAIRLAGQWWDKTRDSKKEDLVNCLPEGMVDGFCKQIEKMNFHSNVKELTERLCGPQAPFGHAEVILSSRGSRLFRSFANVNPVVTTEALYRVLLNLESLSILNVSGNVRRNIVWGLEVLAFNKDCFEKAAWCLFLLAVNESETWDNNATNVFNRLFFPIEADTEAPPELRYLLIERVLRLQSFKADKVAVHALECALSLDRGIRIVGPEYQGGMVPLEPWRPKVWQEIFDYWEYSLQALMQVFDRGGAQKKLVMQSFMDVVGALLGRWESSNFDSSFRKIAAENNDSWPEALNSIKFILRYRSEGLNEKSISILKDWEKLLTPDAENWPDIFKTNIILPPHEHEKKDDGSYTDIYEIKAKDLAKNVSGDINIVLEFLDLFLVGEQRKSFVFAKELAKHLSEHTILVKPVLEKINRLENVNLSFALGLYSGIAEVSEEKWEFHLSLLLQDDSLVSYYPQFSCTGSLGENHFRAVQELLVAGKILPRVATCYCYDSVTADLKPHVISRFCIDLSSHGEEGAWVALKIIYMYCFGNTRDLSVIREDIVKLVSCVSLSKEERTSARDVYNWSELVKKLLKGRDGELAHKISNQLIGDTQYGFDYSDLWNFIKPILVILMRDYGEDIWPDWGDAVLKAQGSELWWITALLRTENNDFNKQPSIIAYLPIKVLISWCHDNIEIGPKFVASCINIFEEVDGKEKPSELLVELIANFGTDKRVLTALDSNMGSRSWSGSLVPYLKNDKKVISTLASHESPLVRDWAQARLKQIDKEMAFHHGLDGEHELGVY